ncbi:hypothetical protein KIM67_14435 [Flagellimonas sp. 389]|uniref:hypothetical protein n=1 Tax=Flagellimonas sp. 389 TaxID=2835862 RepID=UPI001BD49904|nr:hypothetical protein [Flagellimonas sp. 389]MBS9463613.1 hypothetical protein [Flagellimonas sp. 389]
MKRILIDYKKLNHETAAALIDAYPYGYGDDDIITLKKPKGEIIEAVEVRTEDTVYLVKISKSLSSFIANFEENMEKELEKDTKTEAVLDSEKEQFENPELELDTDLDTEGLY